MRARSPPPGAPEAASSCSGGDGDRVRAHERGATAARRERPWAGSALLGRRSPGSHLADLGRPVTLGASKSTLGGRGWGLSLGRSFSWWDRLALTVARDAEAVEESLGHPPPFFF